MLIIYAHYKLSDSNMFQENQIIPQVNWLSGNRIGDGLRNKNGERLTTPPNILLYIRFYFMGSGTSCKTGVMKGLNILK